MRTLVAALAGLCLAGCAPREFAGLLPLEPAAPDFVVGSRSPELRWEELPTKTVAPGRAVTEVVYDLKVYVAGSSTPLYERVGLTENRHRLEMELDSNEGYVWTVRARYRVDSARRMTEWTEREDTWERDGNMAPRHPQYVPLKVVLPDP